MSKNTEIIQIESTGSRKISYKQWAQKKKVN